MSNNDVDVTDTAMNSSSYNEDDDDLEMKIQAVNCPTWLKQKFIFMSNNDLDSTVNTTMNSSSYSDDDGDVEVKFDTHSLSDHAQQNDGSPKKWMRPVIKSVQSQSKIRKEWTYHLSIAFSKWNTMTKINISKQWIQLAILFLKWNISS